MQGTDHRTVVLDYDLIELITTFMGSGDTARLLCTRDLREQMGCIRGVSIDLHPGISMGALDRFYDQVCSGLTSVCLRNVPAFSAREITCFLDGDGLESITVLMADHTQLTAGPVPVRDCVTEAVVRNAGSLVVLDLEGIDAHRILDDCTGCRLGLVRRRMTLPVLTSLRLVQTVPSVPESEDDGMTFSMFHGLMNLSSFKNLCNIDFSGTDVSRFFQGSWVANKIQRVTLNSSGVTDHALTQMVDCFPNVTALSLNHNTLSQDAWVSLGRLSALERFTGSNNRLFQDPVTLLPYGVLYSDHGFTLTTDAMRLFFGNPRLVLVELFNNQLTTRSESYIRALNPAVTVHTGYRASVGRGFFSDFSDYYTGAGVPT